MFKHLLIFSLLALLSSCGSFKKVTHKTTEVMHQDSTIVHLKKDSSYTKITGDSIVKIAEEVLQYNFINTTTDTSNYTDSIEDNNVKVIITAKAASVKDGKWMPQIIHAKVVRKEQLLHPNYNYENISTITEVDSAAIIKNMQRTELHQDKKQNTTITSWAFILGMIGVFATGFYLVKRHLIHL
jgi:hypothetical protein